jgi:ferredoxin-NADP reductase
LFYGNSFIDNTPYKNELDELQKNYSDRLQIHYFYSKDEPENVFLKGRLDEKKN